MKPQLRQVKHVTQGSQLKAGILKLPRPWMSQLQTGDKINGAKSLRGQPGFWAWPEILLLLLIDTFRPLPSIARTFFWPCYCPNSVLPLLKERLLHHQSSFPSHPLLLNHLRSASPLATVAKAVLKTTTNDQTQQPSLSCLLLKLLTRHLGVLHSLLLQWPWLWVTQAFLLPLPLSFPQDNTCSVPATVSRNISSPYRKSSFPEHMVQILCHLILRSSVR